MKKNLLITTSSFPYNIKKYTLGGGGFIFKLAKGLTNNFNVTILAPYTKSLKKFEVVNKLKIFRHKQFFFNSINLTYGSGIPSNLSRNKLLYLIIPYYLISQFFAIVKLVKKEGISIIHAHWIVPQGLIAIIYKKFINKEIKVLITIHGSDILRLNNVIYYQIIKFVLNNTDRITVVNKQIKDIINKIGYRKKIYIYPMGIDTNTFSPIKKDLSISKKLNIYNECLLFIGSCIENKGIRYLIKAMPKIISNYPNINLIIIGEGNLKNEMIKLCKKLGIKNNIIFLNSIINKKLPKYYTLADIFILPSLSEGFPLVVMEALSCKTTTLVTDLPIFTDLKKICNAIHIVPKKNIHAISNEILYLLKNKNKSNNMKKRGRQYAITHFDWSVVIKNYQKLIQNL